MTFGSGLLCQKGKITDLDTVRGVGYIYSCGYVFKFNLSELPDAYLNLEVVFEGAEGSAVNVRKAVQDPVQQILLLINKIETDFKTIAENLKEANDNLALRVAALEEQTVIVDEKWIAEEAAKSHGGQMSFKDIVAMDDANYTGEEAG